MPQHPNSDRLNSSDAFDDDMFDLVLSLPLPLATAVRSEAARDVICNDMWLVIDRDRPVITFRQQVLDAMEAERRRIGTAVAGHG